ncbi:N-6 DNA methylase [Flaviaesturariibacter amylovorans]|uniref:Site-specific DNA-methyltransferase (adenine-specific) n=1 Tax=Flaviaesturariibacter amylovorans TaxID=1084520 RepID=A0ABP8HTV0_9BACT
MPKSKKETAKTSIPKKDVLSLLSALNFMPIDGKIDIYQKEYDGYIILLDLAKGAIVYQDPAADKYILVHDKSTSNLSKPENLVVLECVDRLLRKGYKPHSLELERKWKVGTTKGRLDILVKDKHGKPFLMIECKTWGKEYNHEKGNMFSDGGQLISYYAQARAAKYLCLYTSTVSNGQAKYSNEIINITSDYASCSDSSEIFEKWDKTFKTKGIFDEGATPYRIEFKGLFDKDLQDLEGNSSSLIFNQFAEILRRNVVSDKSNAFNKIFNLFICKIVDEDAKSGTDDQLDFQWKGSDTYETFFDRLNSLYKKGAKEYINIDVEDLNTAELDNLLTTTSNTDRIRKAFTKLRLYKNNEFAFKEVYNEETFIENAYIVKQVVELLQPYRLKYNQKQQFLGDFFELLLNTGFKQEVGQYFTPLPLARFICKSLPIQHVIEAKNNRKEKFFLPYVIDYASGSGHFLTEVMDEINHFVTEIEANPNFIKGGKAAKDEFLSYCHYYKWAREYVYGIEKDYRLAKTTKINTFLNGDGEANIIMGDGLDNFRKSRTYVKKLKEIKDNEGLFDIVTANPPYSIKEFKNTLNFGKESFSLFKYVTEKSGSIECLFVERTKQLLNENGVAGIILPVSFLTNSSDEINNQARSILFNFFKIKACVYLGEKTFMATNVYPVVLFIQKRKENELQKINQIIDKFFIDFADLTCNGIENAFSKYVRYVYKNFSLADYSAFLSSGEINAELLENEIYVEYKEEQLSLEEIRALEKRKIFHFVISYGQKVVVVDSGSGNKELDFLGYEFSTRRGNEGIKMKKDSNGKFKTKLFSDNDLMDETRVNSYIIRSFTNSLPSSVNAEIKDYVEIVDLSELFDFNNYTFENTVRYGLQHTRFVNTKTVKLKTLFEPVSGVTYSKADQERISTSKRVLTSTHIDLEKGGYTLEKPIYLRTDFDLPETSKLQANDLFVSTSNSLKHLGKVAMIDENLDYYAGGFCTILRPKANQFMTPHDLSIYVRDILQRSKEFRAFISLYKNSRISNIGTDLLNFRVPLPLSATIKKEAVEKAKKPVLKSKAKTKGKVASLPE